MFSDTVQLDNNKHRYGYFFLMSSSVGVSMYDIVRISGSCFENMISTSNANC